MSAEQTNTAAPYCLWSPRSDASGAPPVAINEEISRRLDFRARENLKAEFRAWERRQTAELADPSTPPSRPPSTWKSRAVSGTKDQPVTMSDGLLHRIGDEDTGCTSTLMETRTGAFMARVEATLQNICRDETGQFETAEETRERREREERLNAQGIVICDALERQGVKGYREDGWQLWVMGVHSHEITEIPAYRRICLNPYVAHRLRLKYLNWLQYFAQGRENALRFWTFTTGKRVLIHRLEARIKWLHRRLLELNAEPWMKSAGVRIIFRATEFGTLEPKKRTQENDGETGGGLEGNGAGRWYHPHAHCIVWLSKGKLSPVLWSGLLEKVWRFWGHNWDEGSSIKNMREAVKYVVKPGDMVKLAENCPAELARLQKVLFRKKLVQPMDELALEMRAAKEPGLRPALRWVDCGAKCVQRWKLEADANKNRLARGSEGSGLYSSAENRPGIVADSHQLTELTNTQAEQYMKRDRYGVKYSRDESGNWIRSDDTPAICRIMARCSPAYNSRGIKEGRVVVCGSSFDVRAVLKHPLVRRMVSATAAAYAAGIVEQEATARGADRVRSIRVHTGTPTVPHDDGGEAPWDYEEAFEPALLESLAAFSGGN